MKIIFRIGFLLVFIFPSFTFAESIKNFISHIDIKEDNRLIVTETIVYDFGELDRHGIFRFIPQDFKPVGSFFPIQVEFLSVTDENGKPFEYTTSGFNTKEIKIGDPNTYVTGLQTYVIRYEVLNAINFFENEDELYWDVTGNDWQVSIENTQVLVTLPQEVSRLTLFDYCGTVGSNTSCGAVAKTSEKGLEYISTKDLFPGEGITLSISFPKNIITPTPAWKQILRFWIYIVPVFLGVFISLIFMRKRLSRYKYQFLYLRKRPTVVQYDADNIKPLEASYFHDGVLDFKDLSAYIVWAAISGYIEINEKEGEYHFTKQKDWSDLSKNQSEFLDNLVNSRIVKKWGSSVIEKTHHEDGGKGLMSLLRQESENNHFRIIVSSIAVDMLNETIEGLEVSGDILPSKRYGSTDSTLMPKHISAQNLGALARHSQSFRTHASRGLGLVFLFLAVNPGVFIFIVHISLGLLWSTTMAILGILTLIIPPRPPYTERGLEKYNYINGLFTYIKMAERDRINILNAPEKTPLLFEKLLPYAIIFGLEKKWIKEFDGFEIHPSWYHSSQGAFEAASILTFSDSLKTTLSHSSFTGYSSGSGTGGGGSSGGGGGGGGGGSW